MLETILGLIVYIAFMALGTKLVSNMYQHTLEQYAATNENVEHYVVTIPSMLGGTMLANVGIAAIILVVNIAVWAATGTMGDGMVQFCLIYATIFLLMYASVKIWWITVDGDKMVIRRFLRPTREARFSEVERVREDKWHQLVVYSQGHRLVTVNLMCDNRSLFDGSLVRYGVDMSAIPAAEEVIRAVQKEQKRRGVPVYDDISESDDASGSNGATEL